MLAHFGVPVRLVFVVDEVVGVVVAKKDNVTATTAIATVGATPRLIFFAAEAHGSTTAVTGLNFNYTLVYEHKS